ncbi:type II toxin-antitoxin system VapC family toxin [Lamprobacter modestohalophilus]|uniref:type II toxin-antitoxin system VapC family toxin n=1 Tax=Lamprobacter modestohalophilus TaxID=1064514 RepID=UPI002ADED4F4|nr:type II toxin-antitoxin system VapC family toxin [Lamprobacter modestohalophilus]MEA1052266.1 type II toxin-antitoxin system VapC family toxin [Lamprobacter modestohalophilus]
MSYLFDTNIVIYYFNGLTADDALHQVLAGSFNISVITKIEFLGWSEFASDPRLYSQARAFIGHARVFELSAEIVEQTIRLRQQFKTKTPDAIIAATALVNDLTVVTHNTSDFTRLGLDTRTVTMKP